MRRQCIVLKLVLTIAVCASSVWAQPGPQQSFDTLKGLIGKWEGTDTLGQRIQVTFRLTANGSALLNEYVEFGEHEDMITMIHRDGARLLATHYCSAGNQPRMKARVSPDGKTLTFDFVDGTNIPSPGSGHMQSWTIRMLGNDRHIEEWTYIENGKRKTVVSDLRRTKG